MRDWKKIGEKLIFPPRCIIFLLTVVCTGALVEIFINGWEMSVVAYISYALSFYTLTVCCVACWKIFPVCYKELKAKMHKNKYIDRYMADAVFKSQVDLYRSLVVNLIYVVVNAASAYVYRTYWFGIFAAYYAVIAVYTFYITTTAIVDMVKYRKYKSPILSITKVIKMTGALFSMLFLETAMFAQFGTDTSPEVKRIMIMLTGAGISATVAAMAIYMIAQTSKEIKQYKNNKE